jgi:hypothetical protein
LIHLDSDELIHCESDLKDALDNFDKEVHVVRFDIREAVPEQLQYENVFKEVGLFRSPATIHQLNRMKSSRCKQALYNGEYFRAHLGSKSAVRVSAPMRRMHIHRAFGPKNSLVIKDTRTIKLLHYDCCEYEAWKTKCLRRLDGTAPITESFVRENRKQQLADFQNTYNAGAEQLIELYKRMYFIPDNEKIKLISIGVLSQIDLDDRMFIRTIY